MATVFSEISATGGAQAQAGETQRWNAALTDPRQHLLVLRYALFNMVGLALLAVAYLHGYVDTVMASDDTGLSLAIFAVFLAGLAICTVRVVHVNGELNKARTYDPMDESEAAEYMGKLDDRNVDDRGVLAGSLRLKLSHRVVVVRHIANSLVLMGLIGTVIGFIIALSGVDPQKASDFDSISPMVSTLIRGMSTALYTTLVGGILNLWLMVNYHLLATGTVNLITEIQELGERDGGA